MTQGIGRHSAPLADGFAPTIPAPRAGAAADFARQWAYFRWVGAQCRKGLRVEVQLPGAAWTCRTFTSIKVGEIWVYWLYIQYFRAIPLPA
ncbi:hypothetical protein C4K23_3300 [Pseudomonas chlororaphis]|nr:hypothetical protein C4K23_3300 [Pseudomonas chlororaphis]